MDCNVKLIICVITHLAKMEGHVMLRRQAISVCVLMVSVDPIVNMEHTAAVPLAKTGECALKDRRVTCVCVNKATLGQTVRLL